MDPKIKTLLDSIKVWWKQHQYDSVPSGDSDEYNVYDEPPEFVELAIAVDLSECGNCAGSFGTQTYVANTKDGWRKKYCSPKCFAAKHPDMAKQYGLS